MSSNYEWQKQYTKQRINHAQAMAEVHRAAKEGRANGRSRRGLGLLASLAAWINRRRARSGTGDWHSVPTPLSINPVSLVSGGKDE